MINWFNNTNQGLVTAKMSRGYIYLVIYNHLIRRVGPDLCRKCSIIESQGLLTMPVKRKCDGHFCFWEGGVRRGFVKRNYSKRIGRFLAPPFSFKILNHFLGTLFDILFLELVIVSYFSSKGLPVYLH